MMGQQARTYKVEGKAKHNPSGAHSPAQPQRPNWKCPGGGYYNDIVRRRDRRDMEKWE